MEKIVWQTLLFDFYGELLTAHQQKIYNDVVCNDMSCSEVASEVGVSRQGVHDLVRRCNLQLEEYENKLHLVEKFLNVRKDVESIREIAQELAEKHNEKSNDQAVAEIIRKTDAILEEL